MTPCFYRCRKEQYFVVTSQAFWFPKIKAYLMVNVGMTDLKVDGEWSVGELGMPLVKSQ